MLILRVSQIKLQYLSTISNLLRLFLQDTTKCDLLFTFHLTVRMKVAKNYASSCTQKCP